jgi:hypothetical protein
MKNIKTYKEFERLNEGRYDSITNKISSDIFNHWKKDFYEGKTQSTYEERYETKDIIVDIEAHIFFIEGLEQLYVDGGENEEEDYIQVRFEIDPKLLPEMFSDISMNLKDVIRHEIEHLTHSDLGLNYKPDKYIEDDDFLRNLINTGGDRSDYFRLPKEVDANLQGMYYRAKKERRPFIDVIMDYLNAQNISQEDIENILDIWRKRAIELNLPKF